MAFHSERLKLFNDIPALLGYTLVPLCLYFFPIFRAVFNSISFFSYELYLTHILTFATVFHFLSPNGLRAELVVGAVSLALSLVLAYGYKRLLSGTAAKRKAFSG